MGKTADWKVGAHLPAAPRRKEGERGRSCLNTICLLGVCDWVDFQALEAVSEEQSSELP